MNLRNIIKIIIINRQSTVFLLQKKKERKKNAVHGTANLKPLSKENIQFEQFPQSFFYKHTKKKNDHATTYIFRPSKQDFLQHIISPPRESTDPDPDLLLYCEGHPCLAL